MASDAGADVDPKDARPAPDHDHHGVGEHRKTAERNLNRLFLVAGAGCFVMLAEIAGGLYSNSLVLLADAGHYATDIASVLLALLAVHWSLKPASVSKSFGHHRAEVVSAFVQAIVLWAMSAYFLYEAYQRIRNPPPVAGPVVMVVGAATLVVNLGLARLLHAGSGHNAQNLNLRAAYLHILSDVLGSAAAVVAGALVYYKGWHIADPLLTVFITILILIFTWRLTRQSLHILMEGTPAHLDHATIEASLRAIPGVQSVHDLHIWTHTPGMDSLTAHVVLDKRPDDDRVVHAIHDKLRMEFKIQHVTVQIEDPACPCETARHDVGVL